MDINKRKVIYLFTFIILGFVIATQSRSVEIEEPITAIRERIENKQNILAEEELKEEFLKEQYNKELELRKQYLQVEGDFVKERLITEWEDARLKAGFVGVKGVGIILKLSDAEVEGLGGYDSFVVHDQDIIKIVNHLKIAGAQAISVNGERILSTSEIICTGPTVQINRNRYPVPFEIKAIGEAEKLYDEINDSAIIKELKLLGFELDIKMEDEIQINGFTGNINRVVRGLEDLV